MITQVVAFSLLTSVTWAQTLIPSGISPSCSQFLNSLNTDSSLGVCLAPLVSATAAWGPTAEHKNPPTAAEVTQVLDSICSPSISSSCPPSLFRGKLGEFYAACQDELTTHPNSDVLRDYDVLYVLSPFKDAICSKNDAGKYCVQDTAGGASPKGSSLFAAGSSDLSSSMAIPIHVSKRAPAPAGGQTTFIPNTTTVNTSNLLFLFLTGDLSQEKLCTTCTKNVLEAYINFESAIPYGPGLAKSSLLGGQLPLYQGLQKTCGNSFLGGAAQAAGGLGDNGLFGKKSGACGAREVGLASFIAGLSAIVVISAL